jgi:hypothetical protein
MQGSAVIMAFIRHEAQEAAFGVVPILASTRCPRNTVVHGTFNPCFCQWAFQHRKLRLPEDDVGL